MTIQELKVEMEKLCFYSLATWCEELTHLERTWCWERLKVGGEGDNRGWDGWMASPTWWTWVSVNSGSWWWTGRPGVLRFMGSQRVEHDWATDLIWSDLDVYGHLTVNISPSGILIRSPKSAHPGAFHSLVDGNSISEVPRTNRCELSLTPHHIPTATVLTTETKPEPGHLSSPLLLLPWFMPPSTLT